MREECERAKRTHFSADDSFRRKFDWTFNDDEYDEETSLLLSFSLLLPNEPLLLPPHILSVRLDFIRMAAARRLAPLTVAVIVAMAARVVEAHRRVGSLCSSDFFISRQKEMKLSRKNHASAQMGKKKLIIPLAAKVERLLCH